MPWYHGIQIQQIITWLAYWLNPSIWINTIHSINHQYNLYKIHKRYLFSVFYVNKNILFSLRWMQKRTKYAVNKCVYMTSVRKAELCVSFVLSVTSNWTLRPVQESSSRGKYSVAALSQWWVVNKSWSPWNIWLVVLNGKTHDDSFSPLRVPKFFEFQQVIINKCMYQKVMQLQLLSNYILALVCSFDMEFHSPLVRSVNSTLHATSLILHSKHSGAYRMYQQSVVPLTRCWRPIYSTWDMEEYDKYSNHSSVFRNFMEFPQTVTSVCLINALNVLVMPS
jgi:hypothetical protein